MTALANPADMQAYILERLTGETGEPDHLADAARALCTRSLPVIMAQINGDLSAPLDIEIEKIELGRIIDARPTDGSFDAMTVASSIASPDAFVFTLDADALALIVSAMFGGDPETPPAPISREPSPTEIEIADLVFGRVAHALDGSGQRGLSIRFPLPSAQTGAEAQKQPLRDGPAVRMTFRLRTPAAGGLLVVTMPQRLLMKPRGEGGAANERDQARQPEWKARFSEEVMRSAVKLEATIPLGKLTLAQISDLRVGQVIEMPKQSDGGARLSARGKTIFLCEFGKLGEQYTVRVRQPFDESQDLMDGLIAG